MRRLERWLADYKRATFLRLQSNLNECILGEHAGRDLAVEQGPDLLAALRAALDRAEPTLNPGEICGMEHPSGGDRPVGYVP